MAENEEKREVERAVIIGSGPAGWTAAIYLARANLSPIVYTGAEVGGQLTTTTDIENFPGFPDAKDGPELMDDMEKQAKRYGARVVYEEVEDVDLSTRPFVLRTGSGQVKSHAVIICTGASPRMLGLESEKTFWNRGVHTCAVCDGGFYRGKTVAVVGGGDSAMEEATYLTKFAREVVIVHRRDSFRASPIMVERALENPKIRVAWNSEVVDVLGDDFITGLRLRDTVTGEESEIEVGGLFLAIGHTPNSAFLQGVLELNEAGYVVPAEPWRTRTSVEGIFAAGDVMDDYFRQAVTAAGTGCMAALEAERWLAHGVDVEAHDIPAEPVASES